ncbi:MAG: TlpA disulfide reductase family protein [Desulfocapsaceae bacterium]|nr:TlpA disulfide reductase family protein [Desulfocapsaceae bacterium]
MKKNSFSVFLTVIVLAAVLLSWSAGVSLASTDMPAFSLPDVAGDKAVDSREYSGKVLLVVFFATWCPPCMEEVPSLINLQKEFVRDGFTVIGLSVDEEGPQVVKNLIKQQGINYPVAMADSRTIRGFGGVYGIPMSFLVNQKGVIVKKYSGLVPHTVLVSDIKAVMQ